MGIGRSWRRINDMGKYYCHSLSGECYPKSVERQKSGNMYFNSKEAGIKNADFWEK